MGQESRHSLAGSLLQGLPGLHEVSTGLHFHWEARMRNNLFPSSFRWLQNSFPCSCMTEGPGFVLADGLLQFLETTQSPLPGGLPQRGCSWYSHTLTQHDLGVSSHYLCRILLVRSEPQLLPTLQGRELHRGTDTRRWELLGVTLRFVSHNCLLFGEGYLPNFFLLFFPLSFCKSPVDKLTLCLPHEVPIQAILIN